jgi:hypothetical protein
VNGGEEAGGRICVGCSTSAPTSASEYTLVGQKYGWRCKRRVDQARTAALEWYCPTCWKQHVDAEAALKHAEASVRSDRLADRLRDGIAAWRQSPSTPPNRASAFPQGNKRK